MISLKTGLHLLSTVGLTLVDYEIAHCKSKNLVYLTGALAIGTEILALVIPKPEKQKD